MFDGVIEMDSVFVFHLLLFLMMLVMMMTMMMILSGFVGNSLSSTLAWPSIVFDYCKVTTDRNYNMETFNWKYVVKHVIS